MNLNRSIIKFAFWSFLGAVLICQGCASQTASYHYTQKQIEHGDLTFHTNIRVDEYINAFPQDEIIVPENQDLVLKVDPFSRYQPAECNRTLIQIALKTRLPNADEMRKPIGLCFVFDVSGSMFSDNKMADAKSALVNAVAELQDGDELALVTFNNTAKTIIRPTVINQQTRIQIIDILNGIVGGGGTNIEEGIITGYSQLSKFKDSCNKRLLLLTDGQSNVGIITPEQIARKAAVGYLKGARISTIGLGFGVDEDLLRTIAKNGTGHYYFAENGKALTTILREDLKTTVIPVCKDVSLGISVREGFRLVKLYGKIGQIESQNESTNIDIGELNVNDWRIIIAEIEGDISPGSYSPLLAKVSFKPSNSQTFKTLSAEEEINWHNTERIPELAVNTNVARNSVIFGNATCLVEIGNLAENGKYNEALNILDLQMNNNKILQRLDDTGSMTRELASLGKVRDMLTQRLGGASTQFSNTSRIPDRETIPQMEYKAPGNSSLKSLVLTGLNIASVSLPGIWGTVAKLLVVLIQ